MLDNKKLIDEFISTQEKLLEKRKQFILNLPTAYQSGNLDISARPIYSQVFGGRVYRVDPKKFNSEDALLKALDKMKHELSQKDYNKFIMSERVASFRKYIFSALGGYAPHVMHRFYSLSDAAKLMLLLNTDIYRIIGSPTGKNMREKYDEVIGYIDWAEETAKE